MYPSTWTVPLFQPFIGQLEMCISEESLVRSEWTGMHRPEEEMLVL